MPDVFTLNEKMKTRLKTMVELGPSEVGFRENPLLASFVASLGITQEIGTVNDELHRHIRDKETGRQPALSSMKSEIVTCGGHIGVRVFSNESRNLELTHPQLVHLVNPGFSRDTKGRFTQLTFFPHTVAEIVALQDIDLVIVRDWALNTVFGGFSAGKNYYVTNDWEVRQNDGLRMARMISRRRLAFFGTHDLVAHVAGADGRQWNHLQALADDLIQVLSGGHQRAVNHLLIPYVIGVLLDDLAQPVHYGCPRRAGTIRALARLQNWVVERIPPLTHFERFPQVFSPLIEEPRRQGFSRGRLEQLLGRLSLELQLCGLKNTA